MQDRFLGADLIRPPALPDAAKQPARSGCKLSAGTLCGLRHGLEERGHLTSSGGAWAARCAASIARPAAASGRMPRPSSSPAICPARCSRISPGKTAMG